jgi:N-acetyl sugar amidotransferase
MEMNEKTFRRCTRGLWDTTVPGITFDDYGVSNYATMFDDLCKLNPRGEEGLRTWESLVAQMKNSGNGKKYDCIIGVSGGTDSSYLLHLAKSEYGLRPLAVNLDNGWNSETAVQNIKKMTTALNIDLETYVIEYEEIKDLLKSYMKAGLPWIDNPSDLAIQSALFLLASKEKVKFILAGNDFRSEGKQPTEWTYSDQKQMKFLHRKFGSTKLKTYPLLSVEKYLWLSMVKKIRMYYPYNYLDYVKGSAQKFIMEKYGWKYYGEHHHENIFTKWAIGQWMFEKFGIDKRLITYSAQVLSGSVTREEAIEIVGRKPLLPESVASDTEYILKKLNLSAEEFQKIWDDPNRSFTDYPSYYRIIERYSSMIEWILWNFFRMRPKIFAEMKARKNSPAD